MSKAQHQLTEINEIRVEAICSVCGPVSIRLRDRQATTLKSRWRCRTVAALNASNSLSPYRKYKKDSCEECGFVPTHSSQLDVDHIDGDRWNNDPSNLRTLCANCHRLKTHLNRDYDSKKNKPHSR